MDYAEFERRFIARMIERGAAWVTEGGDKAYGKQAAHAAWTSVPEAERQSPEDEADTDISYWDAA